MSKRRVSPEDVAKCEDRYNKAKAVHSVLRHVADLRGLVLEDLSTKVSWPLYKKYGHAFDAFKLTLQDEEDVFVGLDIDEETKQAMITHIKRRLAPQPSKVGFLAPPLPPRGHPTDKLQCLPTRTCSSLSFVVLCAVMICAQCFSVYLARRLGAEVL